MSHWDGSKIVRWPTKPSRVPGWEEIDCGCCSGLEWGGEYPRECLRCNGGVIFRHKKSGALALYPGGPFVGRETHGPSGGQKENNEH